MKVTSITLCLALLSSSAVFAAESHSFDLINKKGVKTGSTTYSLEKSKDGSIKVHSEVDYVADGPGGVHSFDYKIGKDGLTASGSVNNSLDHTLTFYSPSKAHDTLLINGMKNGSSTGSRTMTMPKPDYVIIFTDDTSVWEVLLDIAAAHPHADNIYTMFIPSTSAKTQDRFEPIRIGSPSDATGTLNGKPVALKHYALTFHAGKGDIYTDANGSVLQADVTAMGSKHVRTGFALDKDKE